MTQYEELVNSKIYGEVLELFHLPKFDLLTEDGRAKKKETGLHFLLEVGYITEEEKAKYSEHIETLPTERKDLVVAYFLENVRQVPPPSFSWMGDIHKLNESYKMGNRWEAANTKGIADKDIITASLLGDEASEYKEKLKAIFVRAKVKQAENFVDLTRKRIKKRLEAFVLYAIAKDLSETDEESELDAIPNIREYLEQEGYKEENETLSEEDTKALWKVASIVLDAIELIYLNGMIPERLNDYDNLPMDKDGNLSEAFIYRDLADEILYTEKLVAYWWVDAVSISYKQSTPKEIISVLDGLNGTLQEMATTLKGTKYEPLFKGLC